MPRILFALALCLYAIPATAGLTVCNHTALSTKVALGYFGAPVWSSRGWWVIPRGTCRQVLAGPLNARYYYLYATDDSSGAWDGRAGFCVATANTFEIKGRADCASHGYDRKGFFRIDTGQSRDYTQSLSE
jgi:uncharacterized membrane protein